jgi:flavin reductase (DIM6/NTAB) family NADH-FMN oxidoreductase RutF
MSQQFRDLMAEIPTCVGVIVARSESGLHACTISSLTSLSIDSGKEEVLFVLRAGSSTGEVLKICGRFGVNILNKSQSPIATAAGGSLKGTELKEYLSGVLRTQDHEELAFRQAKVFLSLKLKRVISSETSEIFISSVQMNESFFDSYNLPLVYSSRRFGFASNDEGNFSG